MPVCPECNDSRAVPSMTGEYEACPACVIDAGETFVVFDGVPDETAGDPPPGR